MYCPLACWAWNVSGWGYRYGVLDYAGGGPVEIGSGASALAYSWVLGRRNEKMMLNFRPHNISLITLGTVLLWFGWLGRSSTRPSSPSSADGRPLTAEGRLQWRQRVWCES